MLLLMVKRGTPCPGTNGCRNLQPITFLRCTPGEYDRIKSNTSVFEQERKAYFYVAYPDTDEKKLRDMLRPLPKKKGIPDMSLPAYTKFLDKHKLRAVSDIDEARVTDGTVCPILDGTTIDGCWKSSASLEEIPGKDVGDRAAIASGSYTVGTAGNYSLWSSAIGDITNQTGNLTLTQISDLTDNAICTKNWTLNTYKLTLTANSDHNGSLTGGRITSVNYGDDSYFRIFPFCANGATQSGTIEISKLNFKRLVASPNTDDFTLEATMWCQASATSLTLTWQIYDIIINHNGFNCPGINHTQWATIPYTCTTEMYNILINDYVNRGVGVFFWGGTNVIAITLANIGTYNSLSGSSYAGIHTDLSANTSGALTIRDCLVVDSYSKIRGEIIHGASGTATVTLSRNLGYKGSAVQWEGADVRCIRSNDTSSTDFLRARLVRFRTAGTPYKTNDITGTAWGSFRYPGPKIGSNLRPKATVIIGLND